MMNKSWCGVVLALVVTACLKPVDQCVPTTTCSALGRSCGTTFDNCSGVLDCGVCSGSDTCSAAGTCEPCLPNLCGTRCGQAPDGCGGTLSCGSCSGTLVCGEFTPNVCSLPITSADAGADAGFDAGVCTPATCSTLGAQCGAASDGCGGTLSCGTCSAPLGCGGGGEPNVCGSATATCANSGGRVCSVDCWCWDMPRPQGNRISAMWGFADAGLWLASGGGAYLSRDGASYTSVRSSSPLEPTALWGRAPDDVWAVGSSSAYDPLLAHWDGAAWTNVAGPDAGVFRAVAGFGTSDVWLASELELFRSDGGPWARVPTPARFVVSDLWVTSPSDAWLVGSGFAHWDGASFSLVPPTLQMNEWVADVHASSPTNLWAAGSSGAFRFNGTQWVRANTGFPGRFRKVWAFAADDVWLGGESGTSETQLIHWNGTAWSQVELGEYGAVTALWATGPDDLWVNIHGLEPHLFHKTPQGWVRVSQAPEEELQAVHVSSPTDIWAVGRNGRVLHGDGQQWDVLVSGTTMHINGVSAAAGITWLVGGNGLILRSTGAGFAPVPSSTTSTLTSVFALSATEAFAAGPQSVLRWNGSAWSSMNPPFNQRWASIWASSANDVWLCGSNGAIYRWNGTAWTQTVTNTVRQMQAIFGTASNRIFAVGSDEQPGTIPALGVVLEWNGSTWTPIAAPTGIAWLGGWTGSASETYFVGTGGAFYELVGGVLTAVSTPLSNRLYGVSGTAGGDAYAVGYRGTIVRKPAGAQAAVEASPIASFHDPLYAVWGRTSSDVWAVGMDGAPRHFDGSRWRTWEAPESGSSGGILYAVWGAAANDVWAVGWAGRMLHFDGTAWSNRTSPTGISNGNLTGLWGSSANDVWTVGANKLSHWNGTQWVPVSLQPNTLLNAVWGTTANDVWAVGSELRHFDGTTWTQKANPAPTNVPLSSIWGSGPNDVWAVGSNVNGIAVLRWNGSAWAMVPVPATMKNVSAVFGRSANDVFFLTWSGDAYHWDGTRFTKQLTGNGAGLSSAWGDANGVWAVGSRAAMIYVR